MRRLLCKRAGLDGNTSLTVLTPTNRFSLIWKALFVLGLAMALGPQRALAQRPLGIDVSSYQTTINWTSVKGAGITFAWAKASEYYSGAYHEDGYFTANENNGKAAGVYMGAYHFCHPELNTAASEASYFWSVAGPYIKNDGKSMMPMLDVEGTAFGGNVGATSISDWINQWCNAVSNSAYATGIKIKPVIYISACNANHLNTSVAQWIPWIADYNGQDPQTSTPWTVCNTSSYEVWGSGVWNVWQYTSTGSISGVPSANVDHDVFNGTSASLLTTLVLLGDSASVVSSSVPSGVLPGQTFTATITMNNNGTSTWTNNGANPYKLGSQSAQDNTTWGFNRVTLTNSPISPGSNYTFTFTATAPSTPGTYTFAWQMVKEGVRWFGSTFTQTIIVGNGASVVSSNIPSTVTVGQAFTATITLKNSGGTVWTNNGPNPYKLGSQSPQDNMIWGTNRAELPSSPINPGQNATFTVPATAPATVGTYTFAWKMLQEPSNSFGTTVTKTIAVILAGPGTNFGNYTIDWNGDSTSRSNAYVLYSSCSLNAWYSYVCNTAGTYFDRDIRWMPPLPPYGFTGRGYWNITTLVPSSLAIANAKFTAVDASGNDLAAPITGTINQCSYSCTSPTVYSGVVNNVSSFGGFRSNTKDDTSATCGNTACGNFYAGYSQMHIQAARWQYIDDWICLGGYASASVSDTSNRSFNETNLYLYPAVDTSHGNVITAALGLNGQTPGRVTTGDCNNANTLDFKTNAAAFGGGDNMDSYGFAWIFSPAGASPKLVIGSGDGNRVWVNGALKNDNNSTRNLTRDQDVTAAVSLAAGWSRILFKVHNFTGSFQGTISLRNSSNVNLNEPSVNYYDLGGYYSYGLGYEQDAWYPQIVVSNIYGVSSPVNGAVFYGNNTTVAASGASNGQGPVPYWRTMEYQWGNALGNADSDYADVSGTPTGTSWSHTTSDVSGHRRFHFFAVSQSGRTSFQNSGIIGGSRFQDAGNYARYYDVYVDNLAPQSPNFSSATAAGTTQINLAWAVPLDQGINVAPGSTESAGAAGNQESQNWYRVGDVGVQVYHNDSLISAWGNGTAMSDTGLTANTPYTYTLEARDNNAAVRGPWHNSTGPLGTNIAWTLSVPPIAGSVLPNQTSAVYGNGFTWTAVNGFGPGKLQYYRYAWDTAAAHTWTESETQWSSGTLATMPTSTGTWYLHVKGYNGADLSNGTFDYAVTVTEACSQTNAIVNIVNNGDGTFGLTFVGTPQASYYVVATPDLTAPPAWTAVAGSTNTVTNASGLWYCTVSNAGPQQFYRSVAILPCP